MMFSVKTSGLNYNKLKAYMLSVTLSCFVYFVM